MSIGRRSLSLYLPPTIGFGIGFLLGSHPTSQQQQQQQQQQHMTGITAQNSFQQRMQALPLYHSLRNDPKSSSLHLLCPFDVIPDYLKERHLLAGALNGEDMLLTAPMIFVDEKRAELVGFYALGEGLSGHTNTVHGGLIAAIFDEMLAFTAMPQLPGRIFALTSYLTVRYLSRIPTNSLVVLHTETVGFRGEYDRKVVLRAVLVDGETPKTREDFHAVPEQRERTESFSEFQARMQKRFPRDRLHCVAEAEFVVPRSYAFWLYWTDRLRSAIPWSRSRAQSLEYRYRLPDTLVQKRRNGDDQY